jgi:hypothetical protein
VPAGHNGRLVARYACVAHISTVAQTTWHSLQALCATAVYKGCTNGHAILPRNQFLILHSHQPTTGNTPLVKPIVVGNVRAEGGRV